jgi:hypothetical protein
MKIILTKYYIFQQSSLSIQRLKDEQTIERKKKERKKERKKEEG